MNHSWNSNYKVGLTCINELIGIVSDLHSIDCYIRFIPSENPDLFKITRILKGNTIVFGNEYKLSQLTKVMQAAYIHFHQKLSLEIRDYKLAKRTELPPETYFLTPSDIEHYPKGFKLFFSGLKGEWVECLQNLTNKDYTDIQHAEILGHLSGWKRRYQEKAREQAKQKLDNLLNKNE